jgi:hypothetical protein
MCCFSRPVISVNATKIFARACDPTRQYLVYSMTIDARDDLAMILPLPVRLPAGETDVEFINLEAYPDFFSDLERGFPTPPLTRGSSVTKRPSTAGKLAVVTVGSFEASFVPSVKDFSRLDERFRLADDVWKKLPGYENYGFAVFKLKPGAMTIHPMAFSFLRRDTETVFFPTVHIHDGKVHEEAEFDHVIYCQPRPDERLSVRQWEESYTLPSCFMQMDKTKGIVLPDQHCYKHEMNGLLANRDTFLSVLS